MLNSVKLSNSIMIAAEAIVANKTRALLTGLGIMFGVAAVITMLAIGNGAKYEILSQSKLIGANNIIIKPKSEAQSSGQEESGGEGDTEAGSGQEDNGVRKFSPGLTFEDAESISSLLPTVERVGTVVRINVELITPEKIGNGQLLGVNNDYFDIMNLQIEKGNRFSEEQLDKGYAVCIIGKTVEKKLFEGQDPVGKHIKVKDQWLQIIGVVEEKFISSKTESELGIRNYNNDVYLPLKAYLLRFENRSRLMAEEARRGRSSSNSAPENKTRHQLDELVVQVDETENLVTSAQVIRRMLMRRHNDNQDFEITIPQQLIQQQQKTKDIFNMVLGVIAGISLLVGGIGIMNIMMASVTERTREIGIRRSMGATGRDITSQFMLEAIIISLCGGILGILLGVFGAEVVNRLADIRTITSFASVLVSFGVSVTIGLIFGISPAKKAAEKDPIEALRYE